MGNIKREVRAVMVSSPASMEWSPVQRISRHHPIKPQIRKFFSDLQQLFISFLLFSSYSLKLQNPLVPASAKLQGQILLRFHELSVHQHIHIGQHLVCHLCMDHAAGCQIPIPQIAAVAPDILLRLRLPPLLK
mgnify:CR=1 FL=1